MQIRRLWKNFKKYLLSVVQEEVLLEEQISTLRLAHFTRMLVCNPGVLVDKNVTSCLQEPNLVFLVGTIVQYFLISCSKQLYKLKYCK